MLKMTEIDVQTARYVIFSKLGESHKTFEISVSSCMRKNAGNKTLKQKVKRGHPTLYHQLPAGLTELRGPNEYPSPPRIEGHGNKMSADKKVRPTIVQRS